MAETNTSEVTVTLTAETFNNPASVTVKIPRTALVVSTRAVKPSVSY